MWSPRLNIIKPLPTVSESVTWAGLGHLIFRQWTKVKGQKVCPTSSWWLNCASLQALQPPWDKLKMLSRWPAEQLQRKIWERTSLSKPWPFELVVTTENLGWSSRIKYLSSGIQCIQVVSWHLSTLAVTMHGIRLPAYVPGPVPPKYIRSLKCRSLAIFVRTTFDGFVRIGTNWN